MIYDRNIQHGLVLDNVEYRAMQHGEENVDLPFDGQLKQRHYVARTRAHGLITSTEKLLEGWERLK